MKKIVLLQRHLECGVLHLEYAQQFTTHILDRSDKFKWIQYKVLKNFKKYVENQGDS
jgi:hypothetical protein